MYKINVDKWKGQIAEKGFTKTSFARQLGVSLNTLNSYFANPNNVPYRVIVKSAALLRMNKGEFDAVFFASELTQSES